MRRLPGFEYHSPATVEEAVRLLAELGEGAKIMGGGTDLLMAMKQRLSTPGHLVDISLVAGLDYIEYDEVDGLRMGAGVTIAGLTGSAVIRDRYPALAAAAEKIGSVQIRNVATLGGNLCLDTRCWYYNQSDFWRQSLPTCLKAGGEVCNVVEGSKRCFAVYSGDLAPVLTALRAEVKLTGEDGDRALPIDELFTGDGRRPNIIKSNEMLSEISVPATSTRNGSAYVKLRLREEVDFPILGVAATVAMDNGVCDNVKVVLSAVGPSPLEVEGVEDILAGKPADEAAFEEVSRAAFKVAHPVANAAGTPEYRRRMVPVFVKKALREAFKSVVK